MSTYSNLKIQLIGTGELPGTWGTATNVNWGSTGGGIEQAVVGMATISSGFTGSPLTLTLTLTDTAEAQNARALVLNLTQSLGSAGTLNVPAIQKPYMVINSTGQNVTVQVSGQVSPTPPVIPTGTRAYLYNNGTSVSTFLNYLTSLTLGTDLAVADGGTGLSSGTSGGIPYFSSATAMASSAALAANAIVIGGGAGVAPSTTSTAAGILTWIQTPSSANLAAAVTDETGSGSLVFATSPTLVTPTLGVATATSLNKVAITAPATGSTLTIADGKTATVSNTLTFTGTDSSSVAFGAGGTVAYTGGTLAQFASTTSSQLAGVISDETGSGALVFANTPTLVTPVLGAATATSINKVTLTAPASAATLTLADGSTLALAGAFSVTFTASGTTSVTLPTSGTLATLAGSETLTNKTINLTNNTLTATSAQLATAVTDETGSGSLVFATSPTLTTPRLAGSSTGYSSFASANSSATNYTITFPAENMTVGYVNTPINSKSADYTLVLTDAGKTIFHPAGDASRVYTIPAGGSVDYPLGTVLTFVNLSTNAVTISITTDTLYFGGVGTTGSRTLSGYGVATAMYVSGTSPRLWIITGTGLS